LLDECADAVGGKNGRFQNDCLDHLDKFLAAWRRWENHIKE
jgi:hypothetical protein